MIDKNKIIAITKEQLANNDELFLVDVKVSHSNEVEVIIDSDTNINVDTCIKLSRNIEAEFDREQEDFQLTVTSAGIGQPLRLARQLRKVVGKEVEVVLKSGVKLKGELTEVGRQAEVGGEGAEKEGEAAALEGEAQKAAAQEGEAQKAAALEGEAQSITLKYEEKVLVEGKKRKQTVETQKTIALDDTKSIKEIISFK